MEITGVENYPRRRREKGWFEGDIYGRIEVEAGWTEMQRDKDVDETGQVIERVGETYWQRRQAKIYCPSKILVHKINQSDQTEQTDKMP